MTRNAESTFSPSFAPKVVYDERMNAPAQGASPSAAKPAHMMRAWQATWPAVEVRPVQPVDVDTLSLAHDRDHVEDILALRTPNGFGTRSRAVANSLPFTCGALLTAARWALAEQGVVAAPVSGFHHAGWDDAAGFCTFNGLMVATLALQRDHPGLRVGILDYDYHYGDGTADILEHLEAVDIVHRSAGERWHRPAQATAFLAAIGADIRAMRHCNLVLYQAGADAHIDDPLGGLLDTAQLYERDRRVFSGLHDLGIPVAWTLAGGYQKPLARVVDLHVNTVSALASAHAQADRPLAGTIPARPARRMSR